jgi:trk system potassium uptake protein
MRVINSCVLNTLGTVCIELAVLLWVPALVAYLYAEPSGVFAFAAAAVISASIGVVLCSAFKMKGDLQYRDAYIIIGLGWLVAILLGSLPYIFQGMDVASGIFESASGWSAMGGTTLMDSNAAGYYILNGNSIMGLLFWRAFQQFIGGLGILLVMVALMPNKGILARRLFSSEAIGTTEAKTPFLPHAKDTARKLWLTYIGLNVLEAISLYITGMCPYDAITHAMATVATGGYSPMADSIAHYNSAWVDAITAIFIVAGGSQLSLAYLSVTKGKLAYFEDEEFKFALKVIAIGTSLIMLFGGIQGDIFLVFRYAIYQMISFTYTCGFANTMTYNEWSSAAKIVLLMGMLIGGCLGSTAGGIKMGRILICLKYISIRMEQFIHIHEIKAVKYNGQPVPDHSIQSILFYSVLYLGIWLVLSLALACAEYANTELDSMAIFAAIASSLAGVGPAFGQIWASYSYLTAPGKLICAFAMYAGRLELLPVLTLWMNRR